jgi:hypothetical protein
MGGTELHPAVPAGCENPVLWKATVLSGITGSTALQAWGTHEAPARRIIIFSGSLHSDDEDVSTAARYD